MKAVIGVCVAAGLLLGKGLDDVFLIIINEV